MYNINCREVIFIVSFVIVSLIGLVGCVVTDKDGAVVFEIEQHTIDKKLGQTPTKPIEKVSPDLNLEKIEKNVVKENTIAPSPSSDGWLFMMFDNPLIVKGTISSDKIEWLYRYSVTDGITTDIKDGFYFYSNKKYDINDELFITD